MYVRSGSESVTGSVPETVPNPPDTGPVWPNVMGVESIMVKDTGTTSRTNPDPASGPPAARVQLELAARSAGPAQLELRRASLCAVFVSVPQPTSTDSVSLRRFLSLWSL